jgi:hypothetical protein
MHRWQHQWPLLWLLLQEGEVARQPPPQQQQQMRKHTTTPMGMRAPQVLALVGTHQQLLRVQQMGLDLLG